MRIVFLSFLLVNILFAHKLNLFLFEENNEIRISSYFASGTPCKNCKVDIFNEKKELLSSVKTDKNGEYIIKNVEPKLFIKVEAVGGHAVEKKFELKNIKSKQDIEDIKPENSFLQSIFAILLIAIIFLVLKRIKK
ncbi:carboxypeptidase-like regulatory domain-containing protein [Arcobacter sp. LA11]|uniref:carboxypeptidase-like regulatory domain-containing protein n=1 Tax=Arcobacter sp. LA11 TaxID=1898176 RepID=UPI00093493B9|nr:carboxypeptidase-like regulatory domain-containing protein [Arcobacter sp. LA11]